MKNDEKWSQNGSQNEVPFKIRVVFGPPLNTSVLRQFRIPHPFFIKRGCGIRNCRKIAVFLLYVFNKGHLGAFWVPWGSPWPLLAAPLDPLLPRVAALAPSWPSNVSMRIPPPPIFPIN